MQSFLGEVKDSGSREKAEEVTPATVQTMPPGGGHSVLLWPPLLPHGARDAGFSGQLCLHSEGLLVGCNSGTRSTPRGLDSPGAQQSPRKPQVSENSELNQQLVNGTDPAPGSTAADMDPASQKDAVSDTSREQLLTHQPNKTVRSSWDNATA